MYFILFIYSSIRCYAWLTSVERVDEIGASLPEEEQDEPGTQIDARHWHAIGIERAHAALDEQVDVETDAPAADQGELGEELPRNAAAEVLAPKDLAALSRYVITLVRASIDCW